MKKFFWTFVLLLVTGMMLSVASSSGAAEDELANKLIGRWEGGAATKHGGNEILLIKSVNCDGDQWTAAGRYGDAEKKGGDVSIKITTVRDDVNLEFTTPGHHQNPVHLKLVGDGELEGSMRVPGPKRTIINAETHFKKID